MSKINYIVILNLTSSQESFSDYYFLKLNNIPIWQFLYNRVIKYFTDKEVIIISDIEDIIIFASRLGYKYKKVNKKYDLGSIISFKKLQNKVIVSAAYPLINLEEIQNIAELQWPSNTAVIGVSGYFNNLNPFIITNKIDNPYNINKIYYKMSDDNICVNNLNNFWVVEYLLQRKRIVFHVACYKEIGYGHLYRSIMLAMELKKHDIIFAVSEKSYPFSAKMLASHGFQICKINEKNYIDQILNMNPNILINDILDTDYNFINKIKNKGIKVINFEDIGSGATYSDITINELYEEPLYESKNTLWGHKYYFLRTEFLNAKKNNENRIMNVLLTFGGTDQNDYTRKILYTIYPYCKENNIKIFVVIGPGYFNYKELKKEMSYFDKDIVKLYHKPGVMSAIMEKVQFAISSNGRTIYELAHMNIPAIVICHHERETTHTFSNEENGFINIGIYRNGETEKEILVWLKRFVGNNLLYKDYVDKLKKYDFSKNLEKVIEIIENILEGKNV
jgi:spore coat polysaccharide biosynthesis predicted glycosyltransferase SpsG